MAAATQLSSPARPRGFPNHGLLTATFAPSRPPPRRPEYVPDRIDDTILHVMEQAPGASMTAAEKLACLDVIDVGFPALSRDNLCAARSIARVVGKTPVICAGSWCIKEHMHIAWEAVQHAQRPRINIFFPTREMLMKCKTPDQVVAIATEIVAYARSLGCPDVQFSAEDAGRGNYESRATPISIDSEGYTHPNAFGSLILATANTLAVGAHEGAQQLEVTIDSFSDRGGNASSEKEEPTNDENKNKGLLGFISALTGIIFFFYSVLFTFSVTYPGTPKALVSFDTEGITTICFTNFLLCIPGSIFLPFAAHFKGGKSTDHVGFDIFIWLLFLWLLPLIGECCYTLHRFLKIPIEHVKPIGIGLSCMMVIILVPYIECQRPKILSRAKHMWEKIKGCCLRLQNLPRWFQQAYTWFRAKLYAWGMRRLRGPSA